MPEQNQFRHQTYPTSPAMPPIFRVLQAEPSEPADFTQLHTRLGVHRVILVHGTFMGDDPFGVSEIMNSVADSVPLGSAVLKPLAAELRNRSKALAARLSKDVGNYSAEFRQLFSQLVGGDPMIELQDAVWSGQNHHLARANLAVRLLDQLMAPGAVDDGRILLWGHSHAGNGFALLTNLLANERESVTRFFAACGSPTAPHWKRVEQQLAEASSPHPLARSVVIVTFGTPVRYGWDPSGCRSLVHVLSHRNPPSRGSDNSDESDDERITTKPLYPPHNLDEMIKARYGDWVQAFAIAGTDVSSPATLVPNQKLTEFLESSLPEPEFGLDLTLIRPSRIRGLCARWKFGTRCHADGQNLLVRYEPSGRTVFSLPVEESLFGHGVATTTTWLPAHLGLVMETLFESERTA